MSRQKTNEALLKHLRGQLPEVASRWLEPVRQEMERLCMMAVDPEVSHPAFLRAVQKSAEEMPELWERLDASPLAELLEKGMGAAVVNGAQNE